ncbi:MAG: hypothetical protein JWR07_1930 [Nevskia sp.]|nr:hypothetical protein [Nevskia sp.]
MWDSAMATQEDRPPTIQERYQRASATSDLTLRDGPCDAHLLLAAAYSVTEPVYGDMMPNGRRMVVARLIFPEKVMALRVYRLRMESDLAGLRDLAEEAGTWITGWTANRRTTQGPKIVGVAAKDLAKKVLLWWARPTCHACEGRKHPTIPGTPYLDYTRDCESCHGTGVSPLERLLQPHEGNDARRLTEELNRLSAIVFSDMARLMHAKLEL